MKNALLTQALNISQENLEVIEPAHDEELIDQLHVEASSNPVNIDTYVDDRLEVEQDVDTLNQTALLLESSAGEDGLVPEASMESAITLVNAVTQRYGGTIDKASLESANGNPAELIGEIRRMSASLESAADVSLESYSIKDMWDRLGILNREIPTLGDNIAVLGNYTGSVKIGMATLGHIFSVDGNVAPNLTKAAEDTAKVVDDLVRLGDEATSTAKKAAEIAFKTDWADEEKAAQAIKQIVAMKNSAKDIYDRFDNTFTMGNRKLSVKKFDIKHADQYPAWSFGASLNVSWPRSTTGEKVAALFGGYGIGVLMLIRGSSKREVKISEMTAALEKVKQAAIKTKAIRSATPNKWREHENLVSKLKKDVKGSKDAKLAIRLVSELDRLGWECLNGAFTIMYYIVRGVNDAADSVRKASKNR